MSEKYRALSDNDLMELVKTGDAVAYEAVFERYWALLHRFVHRTLQDPDDATDIVQETFLILWERRGSLSADNALKAFLYTVAKNKVLEHIRHSRVAGRYLQEVVKVLEAGGGSLDQLLIEKELAAKIEAEVANLPPQMREAFQRRRLQGQSIKEIGEGMGLSEATVKRHIGRALKVLRGKFPTAIFFLL